MKRHPATLVILAGWLGGGAAWAEIVPSDRLTTWQPGIPGGIPEAAGTTVDVTSYGADPSGAADSAPAFLNALHALPAGGGVVFIPEGTYRLAGKIAVDRDDVVFRGQGRHRTRLLADHTDKVFEVLIYWQGPWLDILSGYQKGSQTIVLPSIGGYQVGRFVQMKQTNDPAVMYTDPAWNVSWGQDAVGQFCEITAIAGNTISLRTPLHFSFRSDMQPKARYMVLRKNIGFEDFYVEKLQPGGETFWLKYAAYCWIRRVESDHTMVAHIHNTGTIGCEYRENYLHNSFDYQGGNGYGVDLGWQVTDALVENNVMRHLRHAMLVSKGACGNVFGYNLSYDRVQGAGETNLNIGYMLSDVVLHGHYAQFNLFEGNQVEQIVPGDYWGPCPGNTFLRNRILDRGIKICDHSHNQNVIGNNLVQETIYDDGTVTGTVAHGNLIEGSLEWDPAIADHDIPVSYYLGGKPAFYGEETWPSLGADLPGSSLLPAAHRHSCGTELEDGDSDGMPDVWEANCLGSCTASADADSDGDGQCNRDEFVAGTDPSDALSRFCVVARTQSGRVMVEVPLLPAVGPGYEGFQRLVDLCVATEPSGSVWQPVAGHTNVPAQGGLMIYTQPSPERRGFYCARVRLE